MAVQVRLRDGSWATFSFAIPPPRAAWPYRFAFGALALVLAVVALSILAVRRRRARRGYQPGAARRRRTGRGAPCRARLKEYIEDHGRILAAIAHDLKTPLARLRLRTEALDDGELKAKFEGDVQRVERLVSETPDFVRALDSPEPARPTDVVALLESLKADTAQLGWKLEITGTAKPYPAKVQALQRCITNLGENAVRYGKRARIALEAGDDALRIRLGDDGPRIPEGELERVFAPFYRLEASRNRATGGAGLGLAIARTIARAHGGELIDHRFSPSRSSSTPG